MGENTEQTAVRAEASAGDSVLERVLRAERDAELRLDDVMRRRDEVIDAARTFAQAVERTTDRRLEACRRAYGAQSEQSARHITEHALDDRASIEGVDEATARHAALQIARRLVGLPE